MENTESTKNSIKNAKISIGSIFDEDHALDEFDEKMILLNKETNVGRQLQIVKEMQEISKNVSSLKGWPYNAKIFWDKEAMFWKQRVEQKYREFIKRELAERTHAADKLLLELGTGNLPYLKNAINLDVSHEMLATIETEGKINTTRNTKRIQANAEHSLPIKDKSVDAIVAVFLCNYIERLDIMLSECRRVLKENGKLIIVQSAAEVDNYHTILEKHPAKELSLILRTMLTELGFKVKIEAKDIDKKTIVFINGIKS